MKRDEREYLRIAEREGLENASIEWGSPHSRLIGDVDGVRLILVISLSKGAFRCKRQKAMAITNIRRAMRTVKIR